VVLDGRLRTPARARLFASGEPVILVTLPGAPAARRRRLEKQGALVIEVRGRAGRVDIRGVMRQLLRRGIASVLVEGGSEVLGTVLDARLADRLVLFVAGRIVGGRAALPVFGGLGAARLEQAARLEKIAIRRLGPDFRIEGAIRYPRKAG
jgi:diaminohydroxyphosphoribosylaminopyrimidine deaminase/5-amino-6-(5-phosphoribosylamino)uracil reductase